MNLYDFRRLCRQPVAYPLTGREWPNCNVPCRQAESSREELCQSFHSVYRVIESGRWEAG